jgi:hypothetical protein
MTTLAEFRAQYPQYDDMSDGDLATSLHEKYYSDMPFGDFAREIQLDPSWSDVPGMAMRNTPESIAQFGKAMVQPILHPVDTLQNVGDLAGGAMNKLGANELNTWLADRGLAKRRNPEDVQREEATADAVGGFYKDRYGSGAGFRRALATDPVGVAADFSTLLTGGETAATRLPGAATRVAQPIGTAAEYLNPLTVPTKAARVATKYAVGPLTKGTFGLTTGTAYDNIGEAFTAGKAGGEYGADFKRNMRGNEDQALAVTEARRAIKNIVSERRDEYQANMRAIKADQTPIDFRPIAREFNATEREAFHGGHQKASDQTIAKLAEIKKVLREWQDDPTVHNAGGLDALKQRIDSMMPSFTEAGHAEAIVTRIRNAVKDQIVRQAPDYAQAMKAYEESKAIQDELEKSLSLGKDVSIDTTLRKLQSVTRNNANTNYGSRVAGVKQLEKYGAKNLMPRLAGQALSAKMPRGLAALVASGGLVGGVATGQIFNPLLWAGLATTSPRLVGEASYLAGRVGTGLNRASKPLKKGLLGSRGLGSVGLLGSGSQPR